MFGKLKYKFATKGFFDPNSNRSISQEQFLQILRGKVINPNKFVFPLNSSDSSFMVVGALGENPLCSWNGQRWGFYGYSNARESAEWYAKFCHDGESHIVFPKRNFLFYFNPTSQFSHGRSFDSLCDLEKNLFNGESFKGVDYNLKVFTVPLAESFVLTLVRDYTGLFKNK